jgi:23S rRNA (adenine2503-C2)-methyltransferase
MDERPSIYDLDLPDLAAVFRSWGEPEYRAIQVWQGLYTQLWGSAAQFTSVPLALRQRLDETYRFSRLQPISALESQDGRTRKTLFKLDSESSESANLAIEAVLMRYDRRQTLCISTQAGCAMGCVFCATGQMGFRRNLSSGEIIEQVLYYARQLSQEGQAVTNVVVMGMGEPFHNYEATFTAIDRLGHPEGFNFGARRFTISTVGLIPAIRRFTSEHRQVNLAVSLHAADDELRSSLLPINRRYPLDELLLACRDYVIQTHRRISFEWALIRDVNDSLEQARKLAGRLEGFRIPTKDGGHTAALCHVNVIPLNPTRTYSGQATTRQRALDFQSELACWGIPCTIRIRRGIDIQAGCGQLAVQA